MLKTRSAEKPPCRVRYADLWGSRKEKLSFLDSAAMESVEWRELNPTGPSYFFVPFVYQGGCDNVFSVKELFVLCNSGIQTKRDRLTISTSKDYLESVINDFRSLDAENLRAKYNLGKDGRDWSVACAKADIEKSSLVVSDIVYHPFDIRFTVYTGRTKGFLAYPREKLFRHFIGHENIGLLVRKRTPDKPFTYVSVCNTLISEGVLGIDPFGREYVFPLWLYEENMGSLEKRANMDKAVLAKIASAIGAATVDPEQVFAYIYGVLHTPSYRAKFKEFLKTEFPRIPYPKDKAQFDAVAAIGKELIDIHLMRDSAPGLSETRARFPVAGNNEVDEVRFEETPGGSAGRVWINATQHFASVPMSAWGMTIGGYFPAQKWLKDRKCRTLSVEDIKHYQRIIIALIKTAEAVEKLDALDTDPI